MKKKMPAIFAGHGSPMVALAHDSITEEFYSLGNRILDSFGKPKAILCISAHWYTRGTYIQKEAHPRQIYDMYGFPDALYEIKYPVSGFEPLSDRVLSLAGKKCSVNNDWGIDHGTWTVLVHMFPKADIPVVQLSVNGQLDSRESYEIGKELAPLREEGFLLLGSGNIVHNLRLVDFDNPAGTPEADAFDAFITDNVKNRNDEAIRDFRKNRYADYAVPTPDHFLPLPYVLGAAVDETPYVFNNVRNLSSLSMTGYAFGL